ncbi:response regulator [Aurantimonas sp. 22II-16-19i]|uniref:phosphorylase family protein n=1 Tax=Aurantimonas sp. 22II-16-19i TaxID=1317114 RepID=UPI0009FA2509|nr:response regulator [Aurantimonas sp. 22II-16-19i]
MRILIVEDDPVKRNAISNFLRSQDFDELLTICESESVSDAIRIGMTGCFDLIILDLMVPYLSGGAPDSRSGFEILVQLRAGGPNRFTKVICLSAYPDEVASYRNRFDEWAVIITEFDGGSTWKNALNNVIQQQRAGLRSIPATEYLIVCALDEERAGFDGTSLKHISDVSIDGLNLRFVTSDAFGVGAILRLSQMGLVTATLESGRAIELLKPKVCCMSGICAGFRENVELGQVVAASLAWDYQAGKWSNDSFEISPLQIPIPSKTRGIIDHIFDDAELISNVEARIGRHLTRPSTLHKPIIAPMATGSAVVADERRLSHIINQHRKVAALDMETYGVFYAAHSSTFPIRHFFSVKTVVDLADASKSDDIHIYGCVVSADIAVRVVARLLERVNGSV